MSRFPHLISLVAALTLFALFGTSAPASAHHGPYLDATYRYPDFVDGSNLTLWVTGGNGRLNLYDDGASVCQDLGHGFVPAFHGGAMVNVGPETWQVSGPLWCNSSTGWLVAIKSITMTYQAHDDHHYLTDTSGQIYKWNHA